MPTTDHSHAIRELRTNRYTATDDLTSASQDDLNHLLAADLLEIHDQTGISLDNWPTARLFVERHIGQRIQENEV